MGNVSTDGGNDWGNHGRGDGGNCADNAGEKHGGGRARRIGIGPKSSVGADGEFGPTRQNGNGNTPAVGEKHGSKGAEFIDHENGRGGAMHTLIPERIQVDDRGLDASGNDDNGGREKSGQRKAEYVRASQRF